MIGRRIDGDGMRILLVVAFATATGSVAISSFDYMLVEMQKEFGFSVPVGNAVTAVPTVMTLLVVFLAGALGDQLGQRRVLLGGGVAFCIGSVSVLAAPSLVVAILGRSLEGIGGATLAITALALLSNHFSEPRERALVFGVYAAIIPIVTLMAPIIGAEIADAGGWRLVPGIWLAFGLASLFTSWRFISPDEGGNRRSEVITPLLAGVALAGIAGGAVATYKSEEVSISSTLLALTALVALVFVYRRTRVPSLELGVLRSPAAIGALGAFILANAANVVYWTTLLVQYRYRFSLSETALTMMPVQLAAVLGGLFGGYMIGRLGPLRASLVGLSAASAVALGCVMVIQESPVILPVALAAGFAFTAMTATAPMTEYFMNLIPKRSSGSASSFRGAAIGIGATVGAAVISAFVLSGFDRSLSESLQDAGLTARESRELAISVRDGIEVDNLAGNYSIPFEEVEKLLDVEGWEIGQAEADAFVNIGIAAAIVKGSAALVLLVTAAGVRRRRTSTHD